MRDIAQGIKELVDQTLPLLLRMEPAEVSSKASADSWSKKEILGHLIDSATNNHQRFVRAVCDTAANFPVYSQDDWVRVQRYQESQWETLVQLWSAYNRHLTDVIQRIPEDAMSSPCNIGKEEPVTLEFVIRDYLRHLRHHMATLLKKGA